MKMLFKLQSRFLIDRCSNAKQGPHKAYNAYKDFVVKETTALFLAAAIGHFGLTNEKGKLYLTLSQ